MTKRLAALMLAMIIIAAGCSSGYSNKNSMSSESYSDSAPAMGAPIAAPQATEVPYYDEKSDAESFATSDTAGLSADAGVEEKLIKTGYMESQTKDYETYRRGAYSLIINAGGFVERAETGVYDHQHNLRWGEFTFRVPADKYDGVFESLRGLGTVSSERESSENVTGTYYDIKRRMEVKQAEEKRLLELIDRATTITDLLELEDRLTNVRTDIEVYMGRLTAIDRLASFSTISVSLREVREIVIEPVSDDLGTRVKNAFISSVNAVVAFFEMCVVGIAGIFVPLLVLMVPASFVYAIYRRNKRGKDKKEDKE